MWHEYLTYHGEKHTSFWLLFSISKNDLPIIKGIETFKIKQITVVNHTQIYHSY